MTQLPAIRSIMLSAICALSCVAYSQSTGQPDGEKDARQLEFSALENFREIRERVDGAEELIAAKEKWLAQEMVRMKELEKESGPPGTVEVTERVFRSIEEKNRVQELDGIRQTLPPEAMIDAITEWKRRNAPPKIEPLKRSATDASNEVRSVLYDIRTQSKDPENLIFSMQELFRLNPVLVNRPLQPK